MNTELVNPIKALEKHSKINQTFWQYMERFCGYLPVEEDCQELLSFNKPLARSHEDG
jgi:hypothetical protein